MRYSSIAAHFLRGTTINKPFSLNFWLLRVINAILDASPFFHLFRFHLTLPFAALVESWVWIHVALKFWVFFSCRQNWQTMFLFFYSPSSPDEWILAATTYMRLIQALQFIFPDKQRGHNRFKGMQVIILQNGLKEFILFWKRFSKGK